MRVLHFYKTYYPDSLGGTEQVINQLARSSKRLGVHTEVLSLTSDQQAKPTMMLDGHQAHRARTTFEIASTGFSLPAISRFAKLTQHADIIHYHYPWPFMDLVHFMTRVKKPTVVTYHSDVVRQKKLLRLYQPLQKKFLSSVNSIVATSPNYVETSPVLPHYKHKVHVIPIGINPATYPIPTTEKLEYWRTKLGERFFLFIGRLRYYKGLSVLLDALQDKSYPVAIVGSGPLESELKQQQTQLGVKNVHFLGALPDEDKNALLSLCTALVFPSHLRSEAFGISLIEGAMHGKPLISCDIGTGTSYINQHENTGFVIPPRDPRALAAAMQSIWDIPEQAKLMGERAKARFDALFTADKMAERYTALYTELLEGTR